MLLSGFFGVKSLVRHTTLISYDSMLKMLGLRIQIMLIKTLYTFDIFGIESNLGRISHSIYDARSCCSEKTLNFRKFA